MQKYNQQLTLTASLLLLLVFGAASYWEAFRFPSFGPEFPLFFFYSDGASLALTLRAYTYNALMWYRPTAFAVPYWLGEKFLDWHSLTAWRVYHFTSVLATCGALFWLVVRRLGGTRVAGLCAALYFLAHPALYMVAVEVAAFDFFHILFAIVCAGLFLDRRRGWPALAASWLCFAIALTSKEMALAIPVYLAVLSAIEVVFRNANWKREAARLAPFFAVLPAYWWFHLSRVPPSSFTTDGAYRSGISFTAIGANLRHFALWIVRIFAGTGTNGIPMFQSTPVNNAAGIAIVLMTVLEWRKHGREFFVPLLQMLGWIATFLAIPVYAGGFLWHINLPLVGYAALAGMACAWSLERLRHPRWRQAAAAAAFAALLLLTRADVHLELDRGNHAAGFRINQHLFTHPPVAAERLGKSPLIYIEDRLNLGPWWYGCFGRLFNYVYLRHDLEEVIVPRSDRVPLDLRRRWLSHPNAFFFRYDEGFNWHDGSAAFRAGIRAAQPCGDATRGLRIAAGTSRITDRNGRVWEADEFYSGGTTFGTEAAIAGTDTPELYRNERFEEQAPLEYRFCVAPGDYTVRLKFAEIWFKEPGHRVFDIVIDGRPVLTRFDPLAASGAPNRAVDRNFSVHTESRELWVTFRPVIGNPKISAIEIAPRGAQ